MLDRCNILKSPSVYYPPGNFIGFLQNFIIAGSLEAAYSLYRGAREIWGKGGGETLALL